MNPASAPVRKRRKSINEFGDAHELTFSCYRRFPLLGSNSAKRLFLDCVEAARSRCSFEVWAYVIMPEHVHLLVWPSNENTQISDILKQIKQPFAQKLLTQKKKAGMAMDFLRVGGGYRVWQAGGGYDRNLYSPKVIWSAIEYLHQNPVRRGLAASAADWPWSSARFYEGCEDVETGVDACDVWIS